NGLCGSGPYVRSNGTLGLGRGADLARIAGTSWLENSILASTTNGANAYGTITDAGHNLSSDSTPTGPSPLKKIDPKLGPLQDNGGPTKTMAVLTTNSPGVTANSPAIDAIPATDDFPPTDQRGIERPVGAGADIGAFELGYFVSGQITNGVGGLADVQVSIGASSVATAPD